MTMSESGAMAASPSAEELRDLQRAYGFLADVFNVLPDEAYVAQLKAAAPAAEGAMAEWTGRIAGVPDDEVSLALGRDRARLVRHVDVHCIKPPYESLWRGQDENATLSALNAFFLEAGYAPTGETREPSDYAGMELAFMEHVLGMAADAAETGDADEEARRLAHADRFFEEHVAKWVPAYGAAMEEAADTGFYRAVGQMLAALS